MAGRKDKGEDSEDRNEGEALWQLVVQDVTPMRDREVPPKKAALLGSSKPKKAAGGPVLLRPAAPVPAPAPSRDIDRRTLQKLERGQMEIEAVLDLHGHSQAQAHDALTAFIAQSFGRGLRCVLVITGKGRMSGGVLRNALSGWLDAPTLAAYVLKVAPAKGKHGGGGAFYVYLRRARG